MSLHDRHIVAIDDTHSTLTVLRVALEAHGATFHSAVTAAGGIALCEKESPDLVMLDIGLPDKEGLNILRQLKRIDKKRNLPIIMLTANTDPAAREQADAMGADAYITKPFVMEELIDAVYRLLHIPSAPPLTLVKSEYS